MLYTYKTDYGWLVVYDNGDSSYDAGFPLMATEEEATITARLWNIANHIYG